MLSRMEFDVRSTGGNPLVASAGSLFQGALMEMLPEEYGEVLHRSELKPYSQYLACGRDYCRWVVQATTDTARQKLLLDTGLRERSSLFLRQKQRAVQLALVREETVSQQELLSKTYFAQCTRSVRLRFVTPTAFKSHGEYQIIPTRRLLYQSLIAKYDAAQADTELGTPELLDDLTELTEVRGYRLKSTHFDVEGVRIPAFQGEITLRLNGPQPLVNLTHLLLNFGSFAGIGAKTAMGMGGFQLVEWGNRNDGKTI